MKKYVITSELASAAIQDNDSPRSGSAMPAFKVVRLRRKLFSWIAALASSLAMTREVA